ncbi:MAG: ATP-binding protein [Candidatus Obscuribacterales bacterium]|nr:ATP-binding protein [Candidatus Obscuribacterales bacterium]
MLIVITGGPSVGKSTLVNGLREGGYTVISEQATGVIQEGKVLPWVDRDGFQREVLKRQLAAEAPFLESDEPVFLDRGIFDGEAYYICDGLQPPDIFDAAYASRYSRVLILEDLGIFEQDGVRFENLEFTRKMTPVLESCYRRRGIGVTRIPAMTASARLEIAVGMVSCVLV